MTSKVTTSKDAPKEKVVSQKTGSTTEAKNISSSGVKQDTTWEDGEKEGQWKGSGREVRS